MLFFALLFFSLVAQACSASQPTESLSADIWAWRKYGQKPIKGSPYPRGYYRCSSSKGCMARKQVERNRSDPDMFIGGLAWDTTEGKLTDYFNQYGDVTQTAIMGDKTTGRPRGFGFVVFSDPSVLDRHTINGQGR